jgi:hypothetical protein
MMINNKKLRRKNKNFPSPLSTTTSTTTKKQSICIIFVNHILYKNRCECTLKADIQQQQERKKQFNILKK